MTTIALESLPLRRLTICNKRGLHARASAKFVKLASCFDAEVVVIKDGQSVGGTSIMGLMTLAAAPGCFIDIAAVGPDADAALEALAALVEGGFGEDVTREPRE
ncbi:phosphocarrier protein [Rhodopseudomonas julia]|uniref:Phosphocarrier protein n=1 Tax=Rhodopseudomonas julia TaxID=200617 RepID=A0ABU0C487_9BRAD|nr:HPr family phosphocarrier protein [Rhodopseudomonas julia]MDQ0325318.1 phosphocarrier protein [Rhodopseudomonas julia]